MSENVIDTIDRVTKSTAGFPEDVTRDYHKRMVGKLGEEQAGPGCILETASDTTAVKLCLAAWIERLMREEGVRWEDGFWRVISEAKGQAFAAILKGPK